MFVVVHDKFNADFDLIINLGKYYSATPETALFVLLVSLSLLYTYLIDSE